MGCAPSRTRITLTGVARGCLIARRRPSRDRFSTTPDGEAGLNYLCAGDKQFFQHVDDAMRFMAAELTTKRASANVMGYMAQQDATLRRWITTASRNAPCPCGSGKKVKQCHGQHT